MLLMGSELTETEGDFGVVVKSSMKILTQCVTMVKKANSLLEIIRKEAENKTANIYGTASFGILCSFLVTIVSRFSKRILQK